MLVLRHLLAQSHSVLFDEAQTGSVSLGISSASEAELPATTNTRVTSTGAIRLTAHPHSQQRVTSP
jgi:hypothetical protein